LRKGTPQLRNCGIQQIRTELLVSHAERAGIITGENDLHNVWLCYTKTECSEQGQGKPTMSNENEFFKESARSVLKSMMRVMK
jgi:hypothetical protein